MCKVRVTGGLGESSSGVEWGLKPNWGVQTERDEAGLAEMTSEGIASLRNQGGYIAIIGCV